GLDQLVAAGVEAVPGGGDLEHDLVVEHAAQAVGAEEEQVADAELVDDDVDVDLLGEAEGADDHVLLGEVDPFVAAELLHAQEVVEQRVVLGERLDAALADAVDAAVADVADVEAALTEVDRVDGAAHALLAGVGRGGL